MTTRVKLISSRDVLEEHLRNPEFRAEWDRTTLARAVALAVVSYRAKQGMTQTQLAHKLGVRQPHVARLEMGEHNPSLEMLHRLSRFLGLRFIFEVAPATEGEHDARLVLPPRMDVVEDVTVDGSRILVATG